MRCRRLRAWAKWAFAVSAFVVTVALGASPWTYILWLSADHRTRVSLEDGGVYSSRYQSGGGLWNEGSLAGFVCGLMPRGHSPTISIKPSWNFASVSRHSLLVPLWIPSIALLAAATALWWPDYLASRRRRAGACLSCGYDRRGLAPDANCPECGKV